MDQKDDKKAGIPMPTLKDTMKPQLKIKGLQAGQSLVERLKQFKKKDLAFILAGLGVLFMAPLAEHFLMSPDAAGGGDGIKEGWGFKPGAGGLGQGGSVFEGGLNGLAPGGAAGGGSDVITPLNVRDPSALVMGPGAQQQAPATASAAAPAPEPAPSRSSGSSDWKDALSQSAAKAGSAAVKRAALPVPKVPLSNGGLRGLGVASGGGGGSFNVGPVNGAQFGAANRGDSTGMARASRDFRGAATRGGGSPNAGGFEQLKKQAAAAGSDISRAGSAAANLEQAAGRNMGGGDAGGGGGGAGANDKAASGNQDKGSKQMGESLEFLRLKAEQDKAIELKWEMIKKKAMFPIELQQEITKTLIMEPVKAIAGIPGSFLKGVPGSAASGKKWVCKSNPNWSAAEGSVGVCEQGEQGGYKSTPCVMREDKTQIVPGPGMPAMTGCELKAGETTDDGQRRTERSGNNVPPQGMQCRDGEKPAQNNGQWQCQKANGEFVAPRPSFSAVGDLNGTCEKIDDYLNKLKDVKSDEKTGDVAAMRVALNNLKDVAGKISQSDKVLINQTADKCGGQPIQGIHEGNVVDLHQDAYSKMELALGKLAAANVKLQAMNDKVAGGWRPKSADFNTVITKDVASLTEADVTGAKEKGRLVLVESEKSYESDLSQIRTELSPVVGSDPEKAQAISAVNGNEERPLKVANDKLKAARDNTKAAEANVKGADAVFSASDGIIAAGDADQDKAAGAKMVKEARDGVQKAYKETLDGIESAKLANDYMQKLITDENKIVTGASGAVQSTLDSTKQAVNWLAQNPEGGVSSTKHLKTFGSTVKTEVVDKLPTFAPKPTPDQEAAAQNPQDPNHAAAKKAVDDRAAFEKGWGDAKTQWENLYKDPGASKVETTVQKAAVDSGRYTTEQKTALTQTKANSGTAQLGPGVAKPAGK